MNIKWVLLCVYVCMAVCVCVCDSSLVCVEGKASIFCVRPVRFGLK